MTNHPKMKKQEDWKKGIGMLRQWLNEDRIKEADRFVTNEQIEDFLDIDSLLQKERERVLNILLEKGHGSGNWKRLITMLLQGGGE